MRRGYRQREGQEWRPVCELGKGRLPQEACSLSPCQGGRLLLTYNLRPVFETQISLSIETRVGDGFFKWEQDEESEVWVHQLV